MVRSHKQPSIQSLLKLVEPNIKHVAPGLSHKLSDRSFGSDHVPFQQAGIPCFLAIEMDDTDYPSYHRISDDIQNVNMTQAISITMSIAAISLDLIGLDNLQNGTIVDQNESAFEALEL